MGLSPVSQNFKPCGFNFGTFFNSRTCELGLKTGFDFMYT